jgi:hypothetical protein
VGSKQTTRSPSTRYLRLDRLQIGRGGLAAAAVGFDVKGELLPLIKAPHAGGYNGHSPCADFDLLPYSSQRWRSQCVSIDATTSGISARWHGGDCRGPSSTTSTARRTMRSRIGEIPKPTSGAAVPSVKSAVGAQNRGMSIFCPITVVDMSMLSTPARTLGTRS